LDTVSLGSFTSNKENAIHILSLSNRSLIPKKAKAGKQELKKPGEIPSNPQVDRIGIHNQSS
jgi:hypothetical protein